MTLNLGKIKNTRILNYSEILQNKDFYNLSEKFKKIFFMG